MKNSINVIIRTETPNDYPKVYDLHTEAFGENKEALLVDRLRASSSFIHELSIVATIDDKIAGHILFSKVNIVNSEKKHPSLALAPMAVSPDHQNNGIGSMLIEEGLSRAKQLGYSSVLVLGHTYFYPKFNFTPANKWNIKAPFNIPAESFMALELYNGALSGVEGIVEYPREMDFL